MALCLAFNVSFQGVSPHEMGHQLTEEEDMVDLQGIHVLGLFLGAKKGFALVGFPFNFCQVVMDGDWAMGREMGVLIR